MPPLSQLIMGSVPSRRSHRVLIFSFSPRTPYRATYYACAVTFKGLPTLLSSVSPPLVGGPSPHPCIITENMQSSPQGCLAFIVKHDYQSFEADRSGNICVPPAGSFVCCQHCICDSNEGRGENKLRVRARPPTAAADVYKFLSAARAALTAETFGNAAVPCCGVS